MTVLPAVAGTSGSSWPRAPTRERTMNAGTRPAPTNVAFERPSIWQRIVPVFTGFDGPLSLAILLLAAAGMVTMYSAGFDSGTRFVDHGRNMLIAFGILFLVAQIPPQRLMSLAVPLYTIGVILLVAVEFAGVTKKGATRWLNVGVVIQPSEMLKIAVPLMLAWWFQRREGQLRVPDFRRRRRCCWWCRWRSSSSSPTSAPRSWCCGRACS